jgi:hypothetical protein
MEKEERPMTEEEEFEFRARAEKEKALSSPPQPPTDKPSGWSDVPANALQDVKTLVGGLKTGADVLAQGAADLPGYLQDTPIKEIGSDILSGAEKGAEFINQVPQVILDRVNELMTSPVQAFKEHPLNTAADVGSVVFPLLKGVGATEALEGAARGVAQEAGRRGLGFTKGVMRKLNMVPKDARAVAQTMLDNGVIKSLSTTEDLASKTEELQRAVGKGIGDFLKTRNYSFDVRKAINDIESLRPEFKGGAYDVDHMRIDRAIETIKAHGKDYMNFDEANILKGKLQSLANYASNKDATLLDKQIAGRFRDDLDESILNPKSVTKTSVKEITPEYQGLHTPPDPESGAPLHDLTGGGNIYPDDIYGPNATRYYGTGEDVLDRQTIGIIQSFHKRPNAPVKIYRAIPYNKTIYEQIADIEKQKAYILKYGKVPPGVETNLNRSAYYDKIYDDMEKLKSLPPEKELEKTGINPGDWVTINREYAKQHGESALKGDYKIISKSVRAKDIFTNGDSIHEFGYWPKIKKGVKGGDVILPDLSGSGEFISGKKTYGATKKAETALEDKQRMAGNRLTDIILAGGGIAGGALHNPLLAFKTAIVIAAKKGIEKYGWSTTSAIANGVANIVGEYSPILLSAAKNGSQSLTAAHMALYDKSPGYREKIDLLMGKPSRAMTIAKSYDDEATKAQDYAQELTAAKLAVSQGKVSAEEADKRLRDAFGKGIQ